MAVTKIEFNNEKLKEALKPFKDDLSHLTDGVSLDDHQLCKLTRFKKLNPTEQSIFYLYAKFGGTEAAKLLGVSRTYVYKIVNNSLNKINK